MKTIEQSNDDIKEHKSSGNSVKQVSDVYHTFEDLYKRELVLFRLISSLCPKLCFKTLKHYDEENDPMFDGDFMVGIYTTVGPASYHFKLKYLDAFSHLEFQEHGPRYEGYTEEEKNEKINYITNLINSGHTEDDILDMILQNSNLDDSLKPIKKKSFKGQDPIDIYVDPYHGKTKINIKR